MCNSIGQLEINIACLAEINTHWQYPQREASLKTTTKRHWQISHNSTSETEIEYTDLYKP